MKIIPFGSQMLIEPIQKKQALSQSLCEYGNVVAIGSEVNEIKVGDTIGFLVWGLNSLEIDEKKYYFCKESDEFILGKVEM